MAENVYPAGSVMIMTSGEYSDYSIRGGLVAEKECDIATLMDACKAAHALQGKDDEPDQSDFVAWLVASGWARPLDYTEVHIGSYGELKL